MNRLRTRQLLEYVLFRAVVCAVRALPVGGSVALARALAGFVHHVLPRKWTRFDVAAANLRTAFGDELSDEQVEELVHEMWIHLFRMIVEIVQLPWKVRLYNCAEVISFRNREDSVRALSKGRPVIFLSGHYGNWELANTAFGCFGFPMGAVARDLDNPRLHAWFERFREHTGHRLISKRGAGDLMVQYLRAGANLGLLADQDAGRRGLFVDFFGQPASTFKSIALLAIEYDAVICVAAARRLPDNFDDYRWVRFEICCEEVIDPLDFGRDVEGLTRQYTAALERAVRRSPEQYFWLHRRWKSKPGRKRPRKAA